MQSLRPASAAVMSQHRREAVRLAKAQEKAVSDKCGRANQPVPGYTFDELIGKGSFGRVYKGRQKHTGKVVAVKVLDIDDADFEAFGDSRDEQIRDFNKEIAILRRAQESGAENLNQMIEALPVHSQLWLVCEYCPGGSVKTLMRATNDKLAEKYLIVVARELAKALKGLHQAGIMHRDVKAANVLIHESGAVQLCDFGIAAALEGQTDKRRTFIGTLHWMPPELWAEKPEYNDEVDVWGYGCTLFECATSLPPNSDVRERQQLKMRMRRLKQSIALPEKEGMKFSDGLRSLVQFALNPDAASRPSMDDILQHELLLNTDEAYPTASLSELVERYYTWLIGGGQRVSLFMPGGAAAASEMEDDFGAMMTEEWNFSMTSEFEKRVSTILELPDLSHFSGWEAGEGETTPRGIPTGESVLLPAQQMTATERANFELRVQRGEGLANLFDEQMPAYEYKQKRDFIPIREPVNRTSDLPFRAMAEERPTSIASIAIDLGDFDEEDYAVSAPRADDRIQTTYAAATLSNEEPAFILPDAATIRAKRADSKEPREEDDATLTSRRTSLPDEASDPTQEDWTQKRSLSPHLDEAAEITPIANSNRPKERDTMGWSFAAAMSAVSQPSSPDSALPTEKPSQMPETKAITPDAEKSRKHATMEWSFSMAMAEAHSDDSTSPEQRTPGRHSRPAPLLRTMTTPVTSNEVNEAYDDFSRSSTSLSGAYSESSMSSIDFDPFSLDRRTPSEEDGPGDVEFEEPGLDDFYDTRGRLMIPHNVTGPGPDIGLTDSGQYNVYNTSNRASAGTSNELSTPTSARRSPRGSASPRSLGHIRGNGGGASRGSDSSSGSTRTTHNASTSVGTSIDSSNSSMGPEVYGPRMISLPLPNPPSLAAMSGEASPSLVQRELDRLLSEFQIALEKASDTIADPDRGRARNRRAIDSGSEWEDED